MTIVRIQVLLVFVYLFQTTSSNSCNSFHNVLIKIKTNDGRELDHISNDCIERKTFDANTAVTEAHFYRQDIPILGRDSIKHLYKLRTVTIDNCTINQILPNAFRNNPRLEYVTITNCKNLTTILFWVFTEISSLKILHLDRNNINNIENLAFSDLEFLQAVHLKHNSLTIWNADWFKNTTSVRLLDLRYNKIVRLPSNAFNNLKKLQRVYFDFNEIESVEKGAFNGLKKLDYLGLKYNRLKQLNANILPNQFEIKTLLVGANYLNFLSKDLLAKLTITTFCINYNPWKCTCLDAITNWARINNATIKNDDECANNGNTPICRAIPSSPSQQQCSETIVDDHLNEYFNAIRDSRPPINRGCARLH